MAKFFDVQIPGSISLEALLETQKLLDGKLAPEEKMSFDEVADTVQADVYVAKTAMDTANMDTGFDTPPPSSEGDSSSESGSGEDTGGSDDLGLGDDTSTENNDENEDKEDEENKDETDGDEEEPEVDADESDTPSDEGKVKGDGSEDSSVATESIALEATWGEAVRATGAAAGTIGAGVFQLAQKLVVFGIDVTPGLMSKMYKGVAYVAGKTANLFAASVVQLDKYLERRAISYRGLNADLVKAIDTLDLLISENKISEDYKELKYDTTKVINQLKIAESTDFTANAKALLGFLQGSMKTIGAGVNHEQEVIRNSIEMSRSGKIGNVLELLQIKYEASSLEPGSLKGFEYNHDYLLAQHERNILPGDVRFVLQTPKNDLQDLAAFSKAYHMSSIFLAVDPSSFKTVEAVDYMDAAKLREFLLNLQALAIAAAGQENFYNKLKDNKLSSRFLYKGYFQSLTGSKERVRLRDSMVEIVYLKNYYIDKVYLAAAIDIHDYTARVISAGLSFAKKNILALNG